MSTNLSTSRASAIDPSAQAQAARALRRADAAPRRDEMASLAASAADLSQLVAQANAQASRVEQRQRALTAMQSEGGRRLAGERLAGELTAVTHHVHALQGELASVQEALGQLRCSGGDEARRDQLGEQLDHDGQDLVGVLSDLAAVRDKVQVAGGQVLERDASTRAQPRRLQALGEAQALEADRREALHAEQERGHRQPPVLLLPELEGIVREWTHIARDPRGVGTPGNDAVATDGRVAALQGRWTAWNLRTKAPKMMDPNEMTQWVMRQAYRDNTQDMRAYAVRLEFHTSVKARLRDELNRARLWRSEHAPKGDSKSLTQPYKKMNISLEPNIDVEGNWHVREAEPGEEVANPEVLQEHIREIEQALQTAGDDMQMAQIELQTMTQRQQQVLNTLSSLSKAQHETSMAILRKIGT